MTKPTLEGSRRGFLTGMAATGAAALFTGILPSQAMAAKAVYRLKMINAHTDETFNEVLIEGNKWVPEALDAFTDFARDWRRELTMDINPEAVLIAIKLQLLMESSQPMVLLSGYRSPKTNSAIRGAARNSLHMKGWALDIHQPDRSLSALHRAANALHGGGVGYYPSDGFVHVDCGERRHWVG